jgi:hypothetical protein
MGIFSAIGAGIGRAAAQGDEDKARQFEDEQLAQIEGLNAPTLKNVSVEQLGPSAMNGVSTDPRYKQAVSDALDAYGKVAHGGGYSLEDRAATDEAERAAATSARGRQEALMQQANSQGGMGSGQALAAMLSAQQAQASDANQRGTQLAIAGRARALDAYGKAAQIGSAADAQQFGEGAARAQANDSINRFNTSARQQGNYYNNGLIQQDFNNRAGVATQKAGAYGTAAGQAHQRVDEAAGMGAGIGAGVDGAANAAIGVATGNPLSALGGGESPGAGMQNVTDDYMTRIKKQYGGG